MSGIPAGAGSLIGKRLGKYEILALLALGGTAEIYLARIGGAAGFEKYVVVKCLHDHLADDQDFVRMFLDEARISATLDHSNIVQTFELGEHENRYYMVMEFLAGLSLAMVVRRAGERLPGGTIPVPLVLNVAAQACAGLHYAHERTQNGKPLNMVHRDISPQNLVVSFEGVVKVVDFGIARADYRETKTKVGTIKGKFAYMSPEQCVANNVDRRTDVFALGVIVHELLTGRRLFKRNSPYETYQAVLECVVEPPTKLNAELDPALDAIVMKALVKDKDLRYPTAEAFGDAMLGYLHHRGKGSGGNELGRFFEGHFGQEIEEHGERMRELIEGRDQAAVEMGWGEEDEKGNQTVDLTGGKDEDVGLAAGEIISMRPSDQSLDNFVGELGAEAGEGDENNAPRTRIQMNPLELMAQLDHQVAQNTGHHTPVSAGTATGAKPLPAPPPGPAKPGAYSLPKFPDLPNLPTVVAKDAERDGDGDGDGDGEGETLMRAPELAATAIAAPLDEASLKRTELVIPAQRGPVSGPSSSTLYGVGESSMQAAELGTQPENAVPSGAHGAPTDYPVMHGGGRPYSTDLAPSNVGNPQRSPYADAPLGASRESGQVLSGPAMSPDRQGYPQADWELMAVQPAKGMQRWQLAVLFVAAVGGALFLTVVLAKIFS